MPETPSHWQRLTVLGWGTAGLGLHHGSLGPVSLGALSRGRRLFPLCLSELCLQQLAPWEHGPMLWSDHIIQSKAGQVSTAGALGGPLIHCAGVLLLCLIGHQRALQATFYPDVGFLCSGANQLSEKDTLGWVRGGQP